VTLRRRGLYDNDFWSIGVVIVVIPVVIIVGRDRSSGSCADTGADYRAILATHLSANGAAQGTTDCSADRGIFDEIVRPAGRGESTADGEQ
jgi:hypothetical protein